MCITNQNSKLTNTVPHYLSRATVYIFKMNYKKQNILSTSKIPIYLGVLHNAEGSNAETYKLSLISFKTEHRPLIPTKIKNKKIMKNLYKN